MVKIFSNARYERKIELDDNLQDALEMNFHVWMESVFQSVIDVINGKIAQTAVMS